MSGNAVVRATAVDAIDQLAQFCTAEGAFGQRFGTDLPLTGRQIGTDDDVEQARRRWVIIAREDFVEAPAEWAPITTVSVQRTLVSHRVFRIYGSGELPSHALATAAAQELSRAMLARGLNGEWVGEAFDFEQRAGEGTRNFHGVLYADEQRLEMSCDIPALVNEAYK